VFNPYSGVKTSILFFEPLLAQKSDSILFVKIENDGFSLGAQRRAIENNDLPEAAKIIEEFRKQITNRKKGHTVTLPASTVNNLVISKEKFVANGDYNLSGERYRERDVINTAFPRVRLGDLLKIEFGARITKKNNEGTLYPVYGGGGESFRTDTFTRENDVVVSRFAMSPECVRKVVGKFYLLDSGFTFSIAETHSKNALKSFVAQILLNSQERIYTCARGHAQKNIDIDAFNDIQIPLPPIETQREIVAEIENYQKIIDGARQVVDNWKPHIDVDPEWPMVELREICETIMTGPFGTSLHQSDYVKKGIPVINPQNIVEGSISTNAIKMVSLATSNRLNEFAVGEGDIIIGRRGEMGRCAVISSEMNGWLCGTGCFVIRLKTELIPRFAFFQIISPRVRTYLEEQAVGVTMKNLNQEILSSIQIPLPPLETQRAIVADIEAEQALVAANRDLITRMEKKIQAVIARVWGN